MIRKFLIGAIALAFAALTADVIRLQHICHRQSLALKRLTAKPAHVEQVTSGQEKRLADARNLTSASNPINSATNQQVQIAPPSQRPNPGLIPLVRPWQQKPPPAEVPPEWQPFQFNGQTYYKVPLAFSSPDSPHLER